MGIRASSSVERGIGPDATVTLDFALNRLTGVVDKMLIFPENMLDNMNKLPGLVMSQRVLLALTQAGTSREDAYAMVQRNALKVWEDQTDFREELLADEQVVAALGVIGVKRLGHFRFGIGLMRIEHLESDI